MKQKNNVIFFGAKYLKHFLYCFSSLVFLIASITNDYAHGMTWTVLQTAYEVNPALPAWLPINPFDKISGYQCSFCGDLAYEAVQSPDNILSCYSCACAVQKFLQQQNSSNPNALTVDISLNSEYCTKLLSLLPRSYFNKHACAKTIAKIINIPKYTNGQYTLSDNQEMRERIETIKKKCGKLYTKLQRLQEKREHRSTV